MEHHTHIGIRFYFQLFFYFCVYLFQLFWLINFMFAAVWRPGAPTPPPGPASPASPCTPRGAPPPPPLPIWSPGSAGTSPLASKKSFRPVHFEETPPVRRKITVIPLQCFLLLLSSKALLVVYWEVWNRHNNIRSVLSWKSEYRKEKFFREN